MNRPAHLSPREIRCAQMIADRTGFPAIEAELFLTQLQTSDELLAEVMALCARQVPADDASTAPVLAFHESAGWIIGPHRETHYLPMPNAPEV